MKIKKIQNNSNTWYDLKHSVGIKTDDGVKMSEKFYFNGFDMVYNIEMSDKSFYKFTGNHKLKTNNGWKSVDTISIGEIFNNKVFVVNITEAGVFPTMDMEVPDVHYYILENGVHSHNSSFILGQVSPSIEPLNSNYFVNRLAKGTFTYKNPYLKTLLKSYDKNDEETWKSILVKGGSVQHLKFLTQEQKDVFKTFGEITQKEIIIQASSRQKYIDQGQSLNITIPPNTPAKDVSTLLIEGWKMGIKTFYYQRSSSPTQDLARNILECKSCQA